MTTNKTKIYQVKQGYNIISEFESLESATKFFGEIIKVAGKKLQSIAGTHDGSEVKKYAHYWGSDVEFTISIKEVLLYPNKKEAEFAAFNNFGDDEDIT